MLRSSLFRPTNGRAMVRRLLRQDVDACRRFAEELLTAAGADTALANAIELAAQRSGVLRWPAWERLPSALLAASLAFLPKGDVCRCSGRVA